MTYRVLFLGDIVGKPGRKAVVDGLPTLRNEFNPEFIVVNGENSAAGAGITPDIADELFRSGVDAITLGNHAFNKREIYDYLDKGKPIVRPANMAKGVPGRGVCHVQKGSLDLAVINLCGRVFMDGYSDPFAAIDDLLAKAGTKHILVDFHAEATSEKIAFGYYVDGRVSVVVGTHTHVQTSDETVLEGGTAYITDTGMCGPVPSVIGVDKSIVVHKFVTGLPARFEVANEPGVICGVVVDVLYETGRAVSVTRLRRL